MPYKGKTNISTAKSKITNLSKTGTQRPQSIPKPVKRIK
jgi:hypothetical protein